MNHFSASGARIAHIKFLVETPSQSKKLNFTSLEIEINKEVLKDVQNLSGSPIILTVNAMIEGDLKTHSSALDNIINTFSKKNRIEIKEKARFERVPGYPRPTMRIGN
ncbi:MAG: hypothetical protein FJZ98_04670 [Chloroflexi bacterium]|nr:hypothetical protein [Chloroflexota bacterium]